jgi:hypothetical protein
MGQSRGFKALKQMTKMNYLYRNQPEQALKTYKELLGYTKVSPLFELGDVLRRVEQCY